MSGTPIKILHTADCHLDSPLKSLALRDEGLRDQVQSATRRAFARIIDTALSEQVSALLIAGDLFDGAQRSAKTAAFVIEQFDRLANAEIPVFYIKGNHDAENPITGEISLPLNVHVFDGRGGKVQLGTHNVWIHGVSFAKQHAPESLLGKFGAPVPDAVNIAMLHTSLGGAAGHDNYAPCSVADLMAMGFDYWALGHIHKRQIHAHAPWVVMPGIPQGRDIGETGPKSATLLTIQNGEIAVAEVSTSSVEFIPHTIDITDIDTPDALRASIREALDAVAESLHSDSGIVRLTLTGKTALRWSILRDLETWQETATYIAESTGSLRIEKLRVDLKDADEDPASQHASATYELTQLMAQIRKETAFQSEFRAEIEAVLNDLPANLRAGLMKDSSAAQTLAERLAEQGEDQILAQMKTATS